MSRGVAPVYRTFAAADHYNSRHGTLDLSAECLIVRRFCSCLAGKSGTLQSLFHKAPVDGSSATVSGNFLGVLIHIHRRCLIATTEGCVNIGHAAQSTAKSTKRSTVIQIFAPFAGPLPSFLPGFRPLQKGSDLLGRIHCRYRCGRCGCCRYRRLAGRHRRR